jgi:hypothetical protein
MLTNMQDDNSWDNDEPTPQRPITLEMAERWATSLLIDDPPRMRGLGANNEINRGLVREGLRANWPKDHKCTS